MKPSTGCPVAGRPREGRAPSLITAAQEEGWGVGVIATPQGLGFLDTEAMEAQTGYPIRSAWRSPGDLRPLQPADAVATTCDKLAVSRSAMR